MKRPWDYVKRELDDQIEFGAVELDEDGEWKTVNGRYVGSFIGAVHVDREVAIACDFDNSPRRTRRGYWAHWETYEGQIESFKVVRRADLPKAIREDIDMIFGESAPQ